jgi:hypothetical protein
MTAAVALPEAARPRLAAVAAGLSMLRLLRLELRHNAMMWLLPAAIGLFWLSTYRSAVAGPPLWSLRAAGMQSGTVIAFAAPVTGAAVWAASREARRHVTDQVRITAWPRWARLFAGWAATTSWALAGYLGCAAALYGVTAHETSWGGPLWWPAAVAAASLPAFSALGFVLGTFLPSRFTAPLAAIAAFFLVALSTEFIHGSQSRWQVSPIVTGPWDLSPQAGAATFYPFLPDLSIAQLMFLGGCTLALLGVLILPERLGAWRVRAVAASLTGAGLLAAGTAAGLAGTGTLDMHGMIIIPALHDAASDHPLQYTPVCSDTAIPVCVNPAYASYLPATANALAPLLSQLAGLPGAPAQIAQEAATYQQDEGNGVGIREAAPQTSRARWVSHFVFPDQLSGPAMTPGQMANQVAATHGPQIVAAVIGDGPGASQAQNAVAAAVLLAAGPGPAVASPASAGESDPDPAPAVAPGTPAYQAAARFAALPASVRHTWLTGHLAALRAGEITLAQLP